MSLIVFARSKYHIFRFSDKLVHTRMTVREALEASGMQKEEINFLEKTSNLNLDEEKDTRINADNISKAITIKNRLFIGCAGDLSNIETLYQNLENTDNIINFLVDYYNKNTKPEQLMCLSSITPHLIYFGLNELKGKAHILKDEECNPFAIGCGAEEFMSLYDKQRKLIDSMYKNAYENMDEKYEEWKNKFIDIIKDIFLAVSKKNEYVGEKIDIDILENKDSQ